MIRTIIQVLRKHLEIAYQEEEEMEATVHDPFDLIAIFPSYDMLRVLAHDLVETIGAEKCEKHVVIPDQQATIQFLQQQMPLADGLDDATVAYFARRLRRWLLNWNTTVPTFKERQRSLFSSLV